MSTESKNMQKQAGWLLKQLNEVDAEQAIKQFMQCNTSQRWCEQMTQARPFDSFLALQQTADSLWSNSQEIDLLEAFDGHPEIGDVSTLREKYKNTALAAGHEQSGVDSADEKILFALAKGNQDYKEKFGFIFIVCASGKSADEMLTLLLERLPNSREQELVNAAEEQRKITQIRLLNSFLEEAKI